MLARRVFAVRIRSMKHDTPEFLILSMCPAPTGMRVLVQYKSDREILKSSYRIVCFALYTSAYNERHGLGNTMCPVVVCQDFGLIAVEDPNFYCSNEISREILMEGGCVDEA